MLYYTDSRCLAHDPIAGHPESPARLEAIQQHLVRTGLLDDLTQTPIPAPDLALLSTVHSQQHLDFLEQMAPLQGGVALDPDTHMGPGSLLAAQLAASAVSDAVLQVLRGTATTAFCAVRPPGHHAERHDAMGFCLTNSIALGAVTALAQPNIERVAILDFDVHHGNGTVDIFAQDPRVLVCSSYQHPHYPNRKTDIAAPNIVHTPLAAGTGSSEFRQAIERDWLPAVSQHKPQLILLSAGFDAHMEDPLAQLELQTSDYTWVTQLVCSLAKDTANGRIVSALEGGYNLTALAASAAAHIQVLNQH